MSLLIPTKKLFRSIFMYHTLDLQADSENPGSSGIILNGKWPKLDFFATWNGLEKQAMASQSLTTNDPPAGSFFPHIFLAKAVGKPDPSCGTYLLYMYTAIITRMPPTANWTDKWKSKKYMDATQDTIMAADVAKPFNILSAYLTTTATRRPPKDCRHTTNQTTLS